MRPRLPIRIKQKKITKLDSHSMLKVGIEKKNKKSQ
jgi:hypothetical protein